MIGNLLEKSAGSLSSSYTIAAIPRAKILPVARLLAFVRCSRLVVFHCEAKELNKGENPLDLSGAYFHGIDLTSSEDLSATSLFETYLKNALFIDKNLTRADFSGAIVNGSNFSQIRQQLAGSPKGEYARFDPVKLAYSDLSFAPHNSTNVILRQGHLVETSCVIRSARAPVSIMPGYVKLILLAVVLSIRLGIHYHPIRSSQFFWSLFHIQ